MFFSTYAKKLALIIEPQTSPALIQWAGKCVITAHASLVIKITGKNVTEVKSAFPVFVRWLC